MLFYEWLEENEQIYDQCLFRRNPSCCLYHNDHIERAAIEKLAQYLGGEGTGEGTEIGYVMSSILGAACTCTNNEFSIPHDLLNPDTTNLPYEVKNLDDENLVLYYTNVCNKLKDKADTEDICNFFHALANHWYQWKDPAVIAILRVITNIAFKPYKDSFVLHITSDLWKDFFSNSLQDDIKSFNCDVWMHTDEVLALKNKVHFVVQAPIFQNYHNIKTMLERRLQEVQNCAMEDVSEQEEQNTSQSDEEGTSQDISEFDQASSSSQPTQCMDTMESVLSYQSDDNLKPELTEAHGSYDNLTIQPKSGTSISQSEPMVNNFSKDRSNDGHEKLTVTMQNIGDILAPQISLQSPKSPPVHFTLSDIASGFLFHV